MKRGWIVLGIVVAAVAPTAVLACGACVEDKIAATYDHAVIDAAIARHQQVVFVAIDGPVDARRIAARVTAATASVPGIQTGTIRTSASPPGFRSRWIRGISQARWWRGSARRSIFPACA